MPSVSSMILRSLLLIGEKQRGGTLTSAEQVECPAEMNSMVDSWSLQRGMILSQSQTSFALTSGTETYTIGSGATFNMTRPIRLLDPCFVRDVNNTDLPLEILDAEAYGLIIDKTAGDVTPAYIFYDGAHSNTSTATVRVFPAPEAGLTLFLNTMQPLESISSVSQQIVLSPGYEEAIVYNYAIRAAAGFTNVSPEVIKAAKDSLAAIKSNNLKTPISRLDYGIVSIPSASRILFGS